MKGEKSIDDLEDHIQVATLTVMRVSPSFLSTDLNKDGIVNIMDMALVAKAYGGKPGDEAWNPTADVAEPYGEIHIMDIATVARARPLLNSKN